MPIYEFSCNSCGHNFEMLVFSQSEAISCPDCGSHEARKLMSGFNRAGNADSMDSMDDLGAMSGSCGCGSCSGGHCATCH
jgi:putative FmdB family regulatory protein